MEYMVKQIHTYGYDIAIKSWADGKPAPGFTTLAWIPGRAKESSISVNAELIHECLMGVLNAIPKPDSPQSPNKEGVD